MAVIAAKGIAPLKEALIKEPDDLVKAAAAWTLGQIGGHSATPELWQRLMSPHTY